MFRVLGLVFRVGLGFRAWAVLRVPMGLGFPLLRETTSSGAWVWVLRFAV